MSLSPLDSPLWSGLYGDPELSALLGDRALVVAMLRVEVALARACAGAGVIPHASAEAIAALLDGAAPDPADLAARTATDGVPVPALVAALRGRLKGRAADDLHWGATSQDIVDSATALGLGAALEILAARMAVLCARLGTLAAAEAETVMAGRTRSQVGLPTTFGALVAAWGRPLMDAHARLTVLRPRIARLSLHGAVGSDAALGSAATEVRRRMAAELGLTATDHPAHTDRAPQAELAAAAAQLAGTLGKIGLDCVTLAQSGIAELKLPGGGSSTMPHKSNPVLAEALVALARHAAHLQPSVTEAMLHGQFRDGAAWALEWFALRQCVVAAGAALLAADRLVAGLSPDRARMRANLDAEGFGPYAERAVFTLSRHMLRSEAEAAVRAALASGDPLVALAKRLPAAAAATLTDPVAATGAAAEQARSFAAGCAEWSDTIKGGSA